MTTITIKFAIEGFHNWPDAAKFEPEAAFLADRHRHMFHFQLWKEVAHDDRDVEIILFKRKVIKYLKDIYGDPCEFGSKSCEMLAKELLDKFDCFAIEVLEDNENGAGVTYA